MLSIAAGAACRSVLGQIMCFVMNMHCILPLDRAQTYLLDLSNITNKRLQNCVALLFVRNMPGMLQQSMTCWHAPQHTPEVACCLVHKVVQVLVSLTAYNICKQYLSHAAMWCQYHISIVGNYYKRVEVPQSGSRRRTQPYVSSRRQHCLVLPTWVIQ